MTRNTLLLTLIAALATFAACTTDTPEARGEEEAEAVEPEESEGEEESGEAGAYTWAEPEGGSLPAPENVAAPPEDAEVTESGLASMRLRAGEGGDSPSAEDTVSVHYAGWTTDGEMFDSSRTRNSPASFPLNGVIAGWTEGLQLMTVGEVRRFWIPEDLAYGGRPGRPAGMLVFDVELLEIERAPEPIAAPDDVAAPPANAETTDSGLASVVLEAGTGTDHPAAEDTVTVNYTGWTTDGEMFDSSVVRGEPASFPLNRVIAGWTEGLQLMVVGEKRRLWIPEDLAYGGRPGRPAGMLVFDVELLEIEAAPEAPEVPSDVAAPPANAEVTASGLASVVLEAGTGTTHPSETSRVEVHYSGWTTDGEMFDSSVMPGASLPSSSPSTGSSLGWTEGVQPDGRGREAPPVVDPRRARLQAAALVAPAGHAGVRRRAHQHRSVTADSVDIRFPLPPVERAHLELSEGEAVEAPQVRAYAVGVRTRYVPARDAARAAEVMLRDAGIEPVRRHRFGRRKLLEVCPRHDDVQEALLRAHRAIAVVGDVVPHSDAKPHCAAVAPALVISRRFGHRARSVSCLA